MSENKPPNIIDQAINFGSEIKEVVKDAARGGQVFSSPDQKTTRLNICRQCDKFIKCRQVCGVCGCNMNFKTRLRLSHCPLKKW